MAVKCHLTRPPLVEAVVDLRVEQLPPIDEDRWSAIVAEMASRGFSQWEVQVQFTGSFEFGRGRPSASIVQGDSPFGLRFTSDDGTVVVQIKRDGLTVSRLREYRSWESMLVEAQRLWELYASSLQPREVTRIAVRYINQIPIPSGLGDLGEYLTAPPMVPDGLPRSLTHFLTRVEIADTERDAQIHLIQATRDVFETGATVVVLDLDVFRMTRIDPRDTSLWEAFGILHELKDATFFGSITEKTLEQFR